MTFTKATTAGRKLRLALFGESGTGKSYSALQIAFGMGGKVAVIDSEGAICDYADLGDFVYARIAPPYTVNAYLDRLHAAEAGGFDILIIDSLTHAWSGSGGLLEKQEQSAAKMRKRNDFAAWGTVTPEYNRLIEAILQSRCHIIATMRGKDKYQKQDDGDGHERYTRTGTAPSQRRGIEYEFTAVLELNHDHIAHSTKDRTRLFAGRPHPISRDTGVMLRDWLTPTFNPEAWLDRFDACRSILALKNRMLDAKAVAFANDEAAWTGLLAYGALLGKILQANNAAGLDEAVAKVRQSPLAPPHRDRLARIASQRMTQRPSGGNHGYTN